MTNDELVDAVTDLLTQLHAAVDATGDARAQRLANVAHGALEALQERCHELGVVKPFDGTSKPPPNP